MFDVKKKKKAKKANTQKAFDQKWIYPQSRGTHTL
jgi:hypothetical protein